MATTTNYGWTTPDDTGLVKDGASAIRTLGSSVDTSVKALNPGTTSGDLDYYTAATTKARIAKGTAGQVFTMNSGATAPEWQTLNAGGMTLISTTTLTGATVTLSSIPATYNNLQIVIQDLLPATDGVMLRMRFNGDSAANRHAQDAAGYSNQPFNKTYVDLAENDNVVANGLMICDIYNYANTTTFKYGRIFGFATNATTTTNMNAFTNMVAYNQTDAISSFTFFLGAGNFTSGTVLLYGVK